MSLPSDWAERSTARLYPWSERVALRDRYRVLRDQAPQLDSLFELADALGATHVLLEAPYIDYDYRSEFSQHFSRRFQPPPDRNERLIFLRDGVAVGMCVVRPITKPVGRSVMAVPDKLRDAVACVAEQEVRAYGRLSVVRGYPFMSQDGEYGRCAHAAVWSVVRYFHLRHRLGRHSIAAIVEATGTGQLPDRTASSGGLTVAEVRQALRRLGIPVLVYDPRRQLTNTNLRTILCQYLDSGFPLLLNTPGHLTVIVGYAVDAADKIRWIRSDDNRGPYRVVEDWDQANPSDGELNDWQKILVPLPGRIHVPAEAAEAAARRALHQQLGATGGPGEVRELREGGQLRFRTYATQPARWKQQLLDDDHVPTITRHYLSVPAPVWAWITEVSVAGESGQVLGNVMVDATSSRHAPQPVAADIDGWCVYYRPEGPPLVSRKAESPARYPSRLPDRRWAA